MDQESVLDSKFEKDNEKVTVNGCSICYTGPGGELHTLLEKRKDLEIMIEEENAVQYPYAITD